MTSPQQSGKMDSPLSVLRASIASSRDANCTKHCRPRDDTSERRWDIAQSTDCDSRPTNLQTDGLDEDDDLLDDAVRAEDVMDKVRRDGVRRVLHRDEQNAVAPGTVTRVAVLSAASTHTAVAQLLVLGVAGRKHLVVVACGHRRLVQHAHDPLGRVQVGGLNQRLHGAAARGLERA
jgi:hypothetical protein